ncbi:MAG: molybdate ABC transporter substrate-binding protein [Pseudomonadota bacterium]
MFLRFATLLASVALLFAAPRAQAQEVSVFAAASLKVALDTVAEQWELESGQRVVLSYAGTSALARQIQQGAEADIFVSANPDWMDVLEADGLLVPGTRRDVLANEIVLVGEAGGDHSLTETLDAAIARHQTDGAPWLAMALVDAVPAGIYGKAALQSLSVWPQVAPGVVQTENVRAALALVERGEVAYAIVYRTDALSSDRAGLLATFPADTHPPIRYPAALIDGASDAAFSFLDHLDSQPARNAFEAAGFKPG